MKTLTLISSLFLFSCSISKTNHASERYCVVVQEVRVRGKYAKIKPKCQDPKYKGEMHWYRYPTPNVFVGDTVDVCDNQMITGPRF
jgi:hypothetical protein